MPIPIRARDRSARSAPCPRASGPGRRRRAAPRSLATRWRRAPAAPTKPNARLGTYPIFATLLELCAAGVPSSRRDAGVPLGVPLLALAGREALLASFAGVFHADTALPLGATGQKQPPLAKL